MSQISCLCVTKAGRLGQFSKSYDCFRRQTYADRELVVVADDPEYHYAIQKITNRDPLVRHFLSTHQKTLGALRNLSMDLARGDIICQWDDDDYCVPERLQIQYDYLAASPKQWACFLRDQLHYYETTGEVYWRIWDHTFGLIPGTLMARKAAFRKCRYPEEGPLAVRGEDLKILEQVPVWRMCALAGMGHIHVYSYHGKNTWGEKDHRAIPGVQPKSFLLERRELIERSLVAAGLEGPFHVTGSDGLAFTSSCGVDSASPRTRTALASRS